MPYFHATAPGKVYLAHMDKHKVRKVMKKLGFPRLTPHTIQDIVQLEKEIAKVKMDGYAVDIEEMREGVGRVAAPLGVFSVRLRKWPPVMRISAPPPCWREASPRRRDP